MKRKSVVQKKKKGEEIVAKIVPHFSEDINLKIQKAQ